MANCFGLYSSLQTQIAEAYGSDYVPFENNGEVITGLYEANESPYPHSPDDIIENMDPNYVFEVAKGAMGSALHFAVAKEPLGISENDFASTIVLYPNPSDGKLTINLKSFSGENTELNVYDILGKMVYKTSLNTENNMLDLSFLQAGIYEGVFKNGQHSITKKIVLK